LIRIAAPDTPSNAAKEEQDAMSSTASRATAVSCQLVASGSYREALTITPLERPGSLDLRVTAWLDNGGQALAHHTRFRTTLDRDAIARLHQALGTLLEASLQTA
jgi:hypothetical protein